VEDIRREKPRVILIERAEDDWGAWALSDPDLAAALTEYRPVKRVHGIEIRLRADAELAEADGARLAP
jgi:hypothetical protein